MILAGAAAAKNIKKKGKRLFVSFQGAESGLALWLNGSYIGYSEDSFTPSEFELTPYLREGKNKLAAQVFKWTAGSWCEDQDFYRFSGIYRDVYLYTIPEVHIWDLKVQTLLDDTCRHAELTVDLKASAKGQVRLTLAKDGEVLQTLAQELAEETACRMLRHCGVRRCRLYMIYRLRCLMPPGM